MTLDVGRLMDIAVERIPSGLTMASKATAVYLVADASRPPGRDWMQRTLVAAEGLSVEIAARRLDMLIAGAGKGTDVVLTQLVRASMLPRMLAMLTHADANALKTVSEWLEQPVPDDHVRTLIVAGPQFCFCALPCAGAN